MREPTDLPQALYLCTKLENQTFRTNYANNNQRKNGPPPTPARKYPQQNQRQFYPELANFGRQAQPIDNNGYARGQAPNFHNQYPRAPMNFQNHNPFWTNFNQNLGNRNYQQQNTGYQSFQTQNAPPRPFAPKPQPRPEPMEVDRSIRSQIVNYANRPNIQNGNLGKRPLNQANSALIPQKQQRNFHINPSFEETDIQDEQEYIEVMNDEDQHQEGYILDEDQCQEVMGNENLIGVGDINFLD